MLAFFNNGTEHKTALSTVLMFIFPVFGNTCSGTIKTTTTFLRFMAAQAVAKHLLTFKNRCCMGYELESKKRTRRVFRIITAPIFNSLNRIVSQRALANWVPFKAELRKASSSV